MASSQQARMGGSRQSRSPIIGSGRVSESIAPSDATPTAMGAALQSRHNDESWVEIASQPSSSSLSSIGDEIVTTGLRVGNQSYPPRRRRLQRQHYQQQQSGQQHMPPSYIVSQAAAQGGTSSQEEYDESESEEDRLMTSSTENIDPRPATGTIGLARSRTAPGPSADLMSDSEDDDDGTALGRPTGFRPQPNAFTHPPAHLSHRSHSSSSAIPPHHPGVRPSTYTNRSHIRPRADLTSPAYQADHDAALRASLTTLLSCAAAAKSLPGRRSAASAAAGGPSSGEPVLGAGVGPGTQPMELRLVPESEIEVGGGPAAPATKPSASSPSAAAPPRARQPTTSRTTSNSSAPSVPASTSSEDKGKRTASAGPSGKAQRATKKKRTSAAATSAPGVDDNAVTWISPATLTWVLGTGVVLLVSVVGFGAGFVVGREVGRQDILSSVSGGGGTAAGAGVNASSCGGEVIRSTSGGGTLRRWRWGSGMTRLVSA